MARFLHSADLQLGMPFHRIPGDQRMQLREARLDALTELGRLGREAEVSFVVVAGDLFDANTVEDRVIVQACERVRAMGLPLYVLPGNHDHGGADSLYRTERFLRRKPDNMTVLLSGDPVRVGDALLLPAPLLRRHESNPTAHLTAALGRELAPEAVRVGLAHGSVRDFSGQALGESPNHLDLGVVKRADLDYLALGDWHGALQVNERAWYAGAPEPTSFKDNNPGHALVVTLDRPGALPQVELAQVARTRWVRREARLHSAAELAALIRWLEELPDPGHTLVRLELEGVLGLEDLAQLERALEDAEGRLLHLRRRGRGVLPRPTAEELSGLASDGYVRAAIERLRQADSEPAARALHLLWRLRTQGA